MIRTLIARDGALAVTAGLMLTGFVLAGLAAPFDARTISGINPWIKPMKFLISIAIYLATVAWLMAEVSAGLRMRALIRRTIIVTMAVEIVCIAGQAFRGTTSHFNDSTSFDGLIFSLMGIAITINTIAAAAMLWSLRRDTPVERTGYLWGVRLGLAVFVVGSLLGFVIVINHGHSVPGPDGGAGLPFLNWSIDQGDLRVAHFVGLHALQVLPLVGFLLDARTSIGPSARRLVVMSLASIWLLLMGITLALALDGQPLLTWQLLPHL